MARGEGGRQQRGTSRRFTCRFHNWSYDTNGDLVGIPKPDHFGETYHFPVLHAQTINLFFHGNVQCYDTYGRNHRMLLCKREIDSMRQLPEDQWEITVAALPVYWLFPNVQLMPSSDGCYLVRAYPAPGRSSVTSTTR